jgi:hypothetical protein
MATPNDKRPEGAPTHVHIEKKKGFNWLPWLLLALGILALLFALSRCGRDESASVVPVDNTTAAVQQPAEVVAATPNAANASALVGTAGLGSYLAGAEPAPRTFTFEKLFASLVTPMRAVTMPPMPHSARRALTA